MTTFELSETDYLTCIDALANKLMLWDFEREDGESYNDVAITSVWINLSTDIEVIVAVNGTVINNGERVAMLSMSDIAADVQAVINATHRVMGLA